MTDLDGAPAVVACAACGGGLEVERLDEGNDFRCRACDALWHVELGRIHRVPDAAGPVPPAGPG